MEIDNQPTSELPFFVFYDFEKVNTGVVCSELPLHCTVTPFCYPEPNGGLGGIVAVREVARTFRCFRIEIGDKTLYGPNSDIPVNKVTDPEQNFRNLNTALVSYLGKAGYYFPNLNYSLDKYSPHVTNKGSKYIPKIIHLVDSVTVGQVLSGCSQNKQIVARFALRE